MEYEGYTITKGAAFGYDFYPTAAGTDCEMDSEGGYKSNVRTANSLGEAMDEIDEIIMSKQPNHEVKTNEGIKSFAWLSEAVRYAIEKNGILLTQINSI
jgi:hypothetical protein